MLCVVSYALSNSVTLSYIILTVMSSCIQVREIDTTECVHIKAGQGHGFLPVHVCVCVSGWIHACVFIQVQTHVFVIDHTNFPANHKLAV